MRIMAKGETEAIEALRGDRMLLREQIRQSQDTIARSQALLKRIDAILATADKKP